MPLSGLDGDKGKSRPCHASRDRGVLLTDSSRSTILQMAETMQSIGSVSFCHSWKGLTRHVHVESITGFGEHGVKPRLGGRV